jgi:hypothetical protein
MRIVRVENGWENSVGRFGAMSIKLLVDEDRNTYLAGAARSCSNGRRQSEFWARIYLFLQNAGMRMIPHGGPNPSRETKNNCASAVFRAKLQ